MTTRRVKNFAKGTVSGTYGSGDTAVTLSTGHGSRFLDPATDGAFPITWWNATNFADPADDPNREVCLCTARAGDVLTVTRGQEDTSASTKNGAGTYKIIAGITADMWNSDETLSQTFRKLTLSTHPDSDVAASRLLFSADAIVMSDGEEVSNWSNVVIDITASGAGGIDTGTEQSSTWYEAYAIYNGTTKAGCLHRAKDWFLDLDITAGEDATQGIRSAVDNSTVRVAQGFTPVTAGKLVMIDVELIKVGAPTGNIWFTIEANNGGVPSNTPLATSWKFDVSRIPTTAGGTTMRIPFLVPATVSAATLYHVVAHGDWTVSATNYVGWRMDGSAAAYAGGSKALYNSGTTTWTTDTDDDLWLKVYIERNNVDFSTTVPAGYRHALIGYAYNNSGGNLVPCLQQGRHWRLMRAQADGLVVNEGSATITLIDLRTALPAAPMILAMLGITGSGAAVTAAALGDITSPDAAYLSTSGGSFVHLYASSTAEVINDPTEMLVRHNAIYLEFSGAGGDFYVCGFTW